MNQNKMMSLKVSDKVQHIRLDQLKPHQRNEEVYGSGESITDLVESIKLKGYVQPLLVKADGTIISGHRRWRTLTALGWELAPVKVCEFETEEDELFVLVIENRHRQQTPLQRIREGITVEPIAKKLRNSHAALKNPTANSVELPLSDKEQHSMENFPLDVIALNLTDSEMQLTENIVAAIVGLGCGRNYRKGRKAVKAAEDFKKDYPELANVWLDIINTQSIDAGYQIAKMPEDKRTATLEVIASGAAKTPKQAKAVIKAGFSKSSSSQLAINNGNSENVYSNSETNPNLENNSETNLSTDGLTTKKSFTQQCVGTWVVVKIPRIAKEKIPERKWNGFWGKITEVGVTLKVDMGTEVLSLLQSDVAIIENPAPNFSQVAERILRLQNFDTVHEFGKAILNKMQRNSSWDAAALAYLDAVEQIELARRAIEQVL